jgi:hypothetical protein
MNVCSGVAAACDLHSMHWAVSGQLQPALCGCTMDWCGGGIVRQEVVYSSAAAHQAGSSTFWQQHPQELQQHHRVVGVSYEQCRL